MARAVTKYVFAAVLALLSTQAVVPSVRVVPAIEIVCGINLDQQTPQDAPRIQTHTQARQPVPMYLLRVRPQLDAPNLFQRPPPRPSLFA
jgi:hypothetical protein